MNQKLGGEIVFGNQIIPNSQVFLLRKNVFAMVNHRPYLPGHVLVCSRRPTPKISDLTEIETLDLFMSAQEVIKKLQTLNKSTYNITIQNGKDSGQSVPHVHLHLVPHPLPGGERRKDEEAKRNEEDMSTEAAKYRTCFQQSAQ